MNATWIKAALAAFSNSKYEDEPIGVGVGVGIGIGIDKTKHFRP